LDFKCLQTLVGQTPTGFSVNSELRISPQPSQAQAAQVTN
jgi:hypothetical protein